MDLDCASVGLELLQVGLELLQVSRVPTCLPFLLCLPCAYALCMHSCMSYMNILYVCPTCMPGMFVELQGLGRRALEFRPQSGACNGTRQTQDTLSDTLSDTLRLSLSFHPFLVDIMYMVYCLLP